jgi:peroxiredoxin
MKKLRFFFSQNTMNWIKFAVLLVIYQVSGLLAQAQNTPSAATQVAPSTAQAVAPPAYKEFGIVGKVNKPIDGYVYLQQVISNGGVKNIDSVRLSPANNNFTFKGKIFDDGGFFKLNVFNKQQVLLLIEGGDRLNVVVEGTDAPNAKLQTVIDGSKNMLYYQRLMQHIETLQEKVNAWNQEYAMATNRSDETKQKSIQSQFQIEQKTTIEKIKALFPEMGTSLVALYAVNFLNPDEEIDFLAEVAERFAKDKPQSKQAQTFVASVASKRGLALGAVAPELTLNTPDGKPLQLSTLRGKYVLIDFWASWCGPCRQENPNVVKLYQRFKEKGFEVYSVSLDNDRTRWMNAIQQDRLLWSHVSDLKGWQSQGASLYQVSAIPQTFLIDREGHIIAKNLRGTALEAKLTEILK